MNNLHESIYIEETLDKKNESEKIKYIYIKHLKNNPESDEFFHLMRASTKLYEFYNDIVKLNIESLILYMEAFKRIKSENQFYIYMMKLLYNEYKDLLNKGDSLFSQGLISFINLEKLFYPDCKIIFKTSGIKCGALIKYVEYGTSDNILIKEQIFKIYAYRIYRKDEKYIKKLECIAISSFYGFKKIN